MFKHINYPSVVQFGHIHFFPKFYWLAGTNVRQKEYILKTAVYFQWTLVSSYSGGDNLNLKSKRMSHLNISYWLHFAKCYT